MFYKVFARDTYPKRPRCVLAGDDGCVVFLEIRLRGGGVDPLVRRRGRLRVYGIDHHRRCMVNVNGLCRHRVQRVVMVTVGR